MAMPRSNAKDRTLIIRRGAYDKFNLSKVDNEPSERIKDYVRTSPSNLPLSQVLILLCLHGYSLRVGFTTSAAQKKGAAIWAIMK